jgi:alkanesulfonate monooxygenase SsuD/methylene tetrahydromethanopterin reductase-like flavin-dependent oxidoreductase (luciferase family)
MRFCHWGLQPIKLVMIFLLFQIILFILKISLYLIPTLMMGVCGGNQGTDWPDPINSLSFLAGATKNIRFYTSVYVLPARNPLRVAKEVSTLDAFSQGRFDLGIGMGWMPEEFEAGGQEFKRRGARADEMLEIMKLLWTGEMVDFKGQIF